ncbi:MAG: hypothetical protein GEU80_01190 [Dehalococcoidia bacterium]|nr:hypothetical protein [Dehalococcoidia bacterium]
MSNVDCFEVVWSLTTLFAQEDTKRALHRLRDEQAPPDAFVELLTAHAAPEIGDLMRIEFAELPTTTVATIIEAWAMADAAGKAFEVLSVKPERPLEFARHKRVRFTVDAEEDRVRVFVSHVPTRHASWYSPVTA